MRRDATLGDMIRYLQSLSRSGAAVFVAVGLRCDADQMRLVRRWDNAFPDAPDADSPQSFTVFAGEPQAGVLDWHELLPGVAHWYGLYFRVVGAWVRDDVQSIVPENQMHTPTLDSLDLIRERLEVGLNALVDAKVLLHPRGRFRVLTASPVIDDTPMPAVAVRLLQSASEQHYIGALVAREALEDGEVADVEGWLSRYRVQIQVWSLNPDERRLLRRAVRDVLIANRDVLDMVGVQEVDVTLSDLDDFDTYSAPLYITTATLSYLAPDAVWDRAPALAALDVRVDVLAGPLAFW